MVTGRTLESGATMVIRRYRQITPTYSRNLTPRIPSPPRPLWPLKSPIVGSFLLSLLCAEVTDSKLEQLFAGRRKPDLGGQEIPRAPTPRSFKLLVRIWMWRMRRLVRRRTSRQHDEIGSNERDDFPDLTPHFSLNYRLTTHLSSPTVRDEDFLAQR